MLRLPLVDQIENKEAARMKWFDRDNRHVISLLMCALAFAVVFTFSCNPLVNAAGMDRAYLFSMDREEEIAKFDNDNTGAELEFSREVVRQGIGAMKVTPSGEAPETKIAVDIAGDVLREWMGKDALGIHVYIPENMEIVPNSFFLGMADLSDGWAWVDGVFPRVEVAPGWNDVVYKLSDAMKNVKEDGHYKIYLSFFAVDDGNAKIPLAEPFFVDGIWAQILDGDASSAASGLVGNWLWTMEDEAELAGYDNDNTGARFELESGIVCQGLRSAQVIPDGKAVETKLALDLAGERLERWIGQREVVLNIYLPPENELNPTMFFLGMADLSNGWDWVGGIFAEADLELGWNRVTYPLPEEMSNLKPDGKYKLYFAWAHVDEGGKKLPLKEKFYIDGIGLAEVTLSRDDLVKQIPEEIRQEVAALLELDDDALVEAVARKTFSYLWNEANPANGLIRDRSTKDSPCSIAAVGFGLSAIPVGIERGWITRDEGYERTLTTLKTFANGGVEGKNGFYYHFVDMSEGCRFGDCEISSIDTALFLAGALTAGQYFAGTEVEALANKVYEAADWQWMMNEGDTLSMGWKPEIGFLSARWNSFNEGLLAYVLAIGSPTYPIPASAWDCIFRPVNENYISLPQETLFVYQYPAAWVDFRNKEDSYANYFNNAATATRMNRLFAVLRRFNYSTYDMDIWGLSACDGPAGYKAYGASEGNHDGTVAPYASIASMPFTPGLSVAAIRAMLQREGGLIWGDYGFVSGFNVDQNWYSGQHVGIDQGIIVLMLENYRSELIWQHFMAHPAIAGAMDRIGFVASDAEYAVTPAYLGEWEKMRLAPAEKEAVASRATRLVTIDGDLSDWAGLEGYLVDEDMNVPAGGIEKVDKARQVLNSTFYVQYDDEYLYIAANVEDEYVVINIKPEDQAGYYRTDSVEFYIDTSRAGSDAGLMKLAVLPFDTEGNVQAVRHEDANPGPIARTNPEIRVASARTERGYAIEVAIPLADLGIKAEPGVTLGFCHVVHNSNDRDAKIGQYARTNIIAWNNLTEVWGSPDLWGKLILE